MVVKLWATVVLLASKMDAPVEFSCIFQGFHVKDDEGDQRCALSHVCCLRKGGQKAVRLFDEVKQSCNILICRNWAIECLKMLKIKPT